VGLVGGDAAKVSPAVAQEIGHAVAVIDIWGFPESKMGEGREGAGVPALNFKVAGSMAYCHLTVASNSRSTARGCWLFVARTVWLCATIFFGSN